MGGFIASIHKWHFRHKANSARHVPATSVVLFRVLFALAVAAYKSLFVFNGTWEWYYVKPAVYFHLMPLPLPIFDSRNGILLLVGAQIVSLLIFAVGGRLGRASGLFFVLSYTYFFLLDAAYFNNHEYLVILLSCILLVFPTPRFSDRTASTPVLQVWLLRCQILLVYIYGGLNKLNLDWLAGTQVGRMREEWLTSDGLPMVVQQVLGWHGSTWMIVYGGLLIDLVAAPLLLNKKMAPYAVVVICAFHAVNMVLFDIGPFPWLMIAACILFFDPENVHATIGRKRLVTLPIQAFPKYISVVFWLYIVLQIVVPARRILYSGPTPWTYQGYYFSWLMMSSYKTTVGYRITVVDQESIESFSYDPSQDLGPVQIAHLGVDPVYAVKYAKYIRSKFFISARRDTAVYFSFLVDYNGHPVQEFYRTDLDLAEVELKAADSTEWILPLSSN